MDRMEGVGASKKQARTRVRARRRQLVQEQQPGARAEQALALSEAFLAWLAQYAGRPAGPSPAGAAPAGRAAGMLRDLSGLTITAFRPLPSEPPVGDLVRTALEAGVRVLLPVTVREDPDLAWVPATSRAGDGVAEDIMRGVALTGDELGPEVLGEVDVALIPGLAVDADGHRLGQGGGYYDRALPRLRSHVPVLVALHDHEQPTGAPGEAVPHEAHDILVHGVLTTAGVTLLRQPGPRAPG